MRLSVSCLVCSPLQDGPNQARSAGRAHNHLPAQGLGSLQVTDLAVRLVHLSAKGFPHPHLRLAGQHQRVTAL